MNFSPRLLLSLCLMSILGSGIVLIDRQASRSVSQVVEPAIDAKVQAVGRGAQALIDKALNLDIPPDRLQGVPEYFAHLRETYPELAGIALTMEAGTLVSSGLPGAASLSLPLKAHGQTVARLELATDPARASAQVRDILLDVAFLGITALLISFEILSMFAQSPFHRVLDDCARNLGALRAGHFLALRGARATAVDEERSRIERLLASQQLSGGDRQHLMSLATRCGLLEVDTRSQPAAQVRGALFVFMMAEELTRPFLPGFTEGLLSVDSAAHAAVLISLPIVVFMAIVALCQLPFSNWSEGLGRRRSFMLGAALAAAGYVGSALIQDYGAFLLSRALSAAGFALVFVSAQGHIVDHADTHARTAGMAVFIRAILVAALCAPPIGGFLVDRFGAASTFLCSAALCIVSFALIYRQMSAVTVAPSTRPSMRRADILRAWRTPGMQALLLGCAVPAKLILTALCFYLVPLALMEQGYTNAGIGRVQMIYPLMMVALVPIFARLAEQTPRSDPRARYVIGGGLIAGTGAMLAAVLPGLPAIMAFLLLLGLGQALSIAPQSSLMAMYAHQSQQHGSAHVLGLFRLIERTGSAAGPALAGALLGMAGLGPTMAFFGALTAGGALAYHQHCSRSLRTSGSPS